MLKPDELERRKKSRRYFVDKIYLLKKVDFYSKLVYTKSEGVDRNEWFNSKDIAADSGTN